MTRRGWWHVMVLVVAGSLAVAGCTSGDSDDVGTAAQDVGGQEAAEGGDEGAGGTSGGDAGGAVALPEGQPISLARSLIFRADVVLEADDPGRAADRAVAIAEAAGGFAADDHRTAGDQPMADLVLRVPSPSFSDVLRDVIELGEVESQSASAEDVTDQVVDLEGRITTARASVERLRGFLDEAATVQDIATLEGELARREADLESLEGTLAVLDDQVRLSTIAVSVHEPGDSPEDEYGGGFVGGLQRGWDALVAVTDGLLVTVGALLPFLVLAVPFVLAWRVLDRRRRARRVTAT